MYVPCFIDVMVWYLYLSLINFDAILLLAHERKKMVTIKLVSEDITKLRYEVAYTDGKHSSVDVNSSIRRFKRIRLPVSSTIIRMPVERGGKVLLLLHSSVLCIMACQLGKSLPGLQVL